MGRQTHTCRGGSTGLQEGRIIGIPNVNAPKSNMLGGSTNAQKRGELVRLMHGLRMGFALAGGVN